ncbi:MAG: helix-turn-helix domain-containing protein [Dactylosporangium sp.]|nr:helix-turn-helix domain-containing protein [Dactylosporangium sp.]
MTKRWSAKRKREVVLRLLRGEAVDEVSRELKVPVHQLEAWREQFLESGLEGLKARDGTPEAAELKEARAKIGELTMELELAREALGKKFGRAPRRKSGPRRGR